MRTSICGRWRKAPCLNSPHCSSLLQAATSRAEAADALTAWLAASNIITGGLYLEESEGLPPSPNRCQRRPSR